MTVENTKKAISNGGQLVKLPQTAEKGEMTLGETMVLGEVLAKSGMFSDARTQAQAVVKVLAGRELGLGPIVSMTKIYMVKGKVSLAAELMGALVKKSGEYDYSIRELTNEKCRLTFFRKSSSSEYKELGDSLFTIEDARQAGVAHGDNWKHYPRNLLLARAVSNGCRWYCPHLINGAYTPEEIRAGIAEDEETIEERDALPTGNEKKLKDALAPESEKKEPAPAKHKGKKSTKPIPTYTVRVNDNNADVYDVHKFIDGVEVDIYHVDIGEHFCSCKARGECKHFKLVEDFRLNGQSKPVEPQKPEMGSKAPAEESNGADSPATLEQRQLLASHIAKNVVGMEIEDALSDLPEGLTNRKLSALLNYLLQLKGEIDVSEWIKKFAEVMEG